VVGGVLRELAEVSQLRGVVRVAPALSMLRITLRRVDIRVHAAVGEELEHVEPGRQ
jgi:hypothetical protein